jgi:hypothetical protein
MRWIGYTDGGGRHHQLLMEQQAQRAGALLKTRARWSDD